MRERLIMITTALAVAVTVAAVAAVTRTSMRSSWLARSCDQKSKGSLPGEGCQRGR